VNVSLHDKREFADVINLRILIWGDYTALCKCAWCNHNSPVKGDVGRDWVGGEVDMMGPDGKMTSFEDGRWDTNPRNTDRR
jgi:hypothetical protein